MSSWGNCLNNTEDLVAVLAPLNLNTLNLYEASFAELMQE
jgi:hypothetical protein